MRAQWEHLYRRIALPSDARVAAKKPQPSRFRFPTYHGIGAERWRGRGLQYEWKRAFIPPATSPNTSVFIGIVASTDPNVRQGTVHIDALTEEHRLPHVVASASVWVNFSVSAIRLQDDVIPDPFITKTTLKLLKLSNYQTIRRSYFLTLKLSSSQTLELSNLHTFKLSKSQTSKLPCR